VVTDEISGWAPPVEQTVDVEAIDLNVVTDTTNGLLLVRRFGDRIRFATDTQRWYTWNGRHWEADAGQDKVFGLTYAVIAERRERALMAENDDARDRALAAVTQLESVRKRRAMLDIAKTDARVQVLSSDFDARAELLCCANGVVDLRTGELRDGVPDDMCSRSCAVDYVEGATSELLDEFLTTFIPVEEDADFVFRLLGNALFGGNDMRLLPIFWGETTSGKSQLFATLHDVLGTYAKAIGSSVFRGNLDDKPRPDLVAAMFCRVAWASEAARSWALHADQVKRLTGGEPLPYRDLYEGVVNETPRFTPFIVANEFPRISGLDEATKRRLLTIHMDKTLPPDQEDPEVKVRFFASLEVKRAVLARLVAGARVKIKRDLSDAPERYVLATMAARSGAGHLEEFLDWATDEELLLKVAENEETAKSALVQASKLHGLYKYWLKKHGDSVDKKDELGLRAFGQALRGRGWTTTERKSAGVRWEGWRLGELPMWMSV
jgi:putative DNA primase/helicase